MTRNNQRGQALAFFGIFCLAFMGLAALVIDFARLYFVARETQTVADTSALGGALALTTGYPATAYDGAQTEAQQNYSNATAASLDVGDVRVGNWCSSSSCLGTAKPCPCCTGNGTGNCGFTSGGAPQNAVQTIPHVSVDNIVGLWSSTSVVRRSAVAAFETLAQANPQLPVVMGRCFTCDPGNCSSQPITLNFGSTGSTNAGWWLVQGNGTKAVTDYIPSGCGGGGKSIPAASAGETINIDNGVAAGPVCGSFSCLVGNQYLVPVTEQDCGTAFNQSTVISSFATIRILAVQCTGSPKTITVQPKFIDCSLPENAVFCDGGTLGGSCPDCGTGRVALVQ